jgi:hypothetical protein
VNCLIFWKEAWLKPVSPDSGFVGASHLPGNSSMVSIASIATAAEPDVVSTNAQVPDQRDGTTTYVCQATRLPYATNHLAWWDIRQYLEDYLSGNVGLRRIVNGLAYSIYTHLANAGIGLGPAMRWFYNKCYSLWRGTPYPRWAGTIPENEPTPAGALNLQLGELVRVKSHQEVLSTLNTVSKNRGLYFDAEMVPYCGGTYRVLERVTRIIDERTGKMQELKNPCIILDSVICQSRYSPCRMLCPRSIYPFWREIWLERVESSTCALSKESKEGCGAVSSQYSVEAAPDVDQIEVLGRGASS